VTFAVLSQANVTAADAATDGASKRTHGPRYRTLKAAGAQAEGRQEVVVKKLVLKRDGKRGLSGASIRLELAWTPRPADRRKKAVLVNVTAR